MSPEKDKYNFELCKRRGVRDKPHPLITDSMLLQAMTVAARINGYERLVQKNRDFFMTGPLMRCLECDKNVDKKLEDEIVLTRMHEEFLRVPRGRRSHYRGEIQTRAFWDNIRLLLRTDEEDGEEANGEVDEEVKEEVHGNVESKSKIPFPFPFQDSTDELEEVKDDERVEDRKVRPLLLASEVGMDAVRLDLINGREQFVSIVQVLALKPLKLASNDLGKFRHPRADSTRQYQEAIDFDTSSLSPENALPARVLSLRAQIALGQAEDVRAAVEGEDDVELKAVGALALFATGDEEKAIELITKLAEDSSDNATVQVLGGTVLQAAGKSEEALQLLGLHQGSLEAVALMVQIHLEQNRTDLAIKEVQQARRWAQDSLLVNLAESWVGLRVGGEKYQQAFYVFEELAQAPSTSSTQTLVAQAIAEIHLGRLEEAEAALEQAFSKDPENSEVLANNIILNTISGKDSSDLLRYACFFARIILEPEIATSAMYGAAISSSLRRTSPEHAFLKDLEEKSSLFDKAATKYSAKVAAA
ncbi:hypothetical protein DSL72_002672 [Monilinia vaccinii-corymbosi]|uniref:Coatomer subunit epsilon n=1 Tax=Monilinia vaccinii-corymbosi TaxID=61207 RepID=A0A8A3PD52_9HELO|nr:hypothetical protein DSL72_002672 [Monilinia vaccinii-corymbosi]